MTIGSKIAALRAKAGLTQEELADILHVSRQAVQKWESDTTRPELDKLVAIAEYFNVTLDGLVCAKTAANNDEELRFNREFVPSYADMHGWEVYSANIHIECVQMADEGYDIEPYKKLANEISLLPPGKAREEMAEILYGLLKSCKKQEGYKFNEPSDLEGIKALCEGSSDKAAPVDIKTLKEKIKGAWLGRIAGCLLGKPIEGIRTKELIPLLKETGNYPMHRYITADEITDEIATKYTFPIKKRSYAKTIPNAPSDDDTNYTVMAATRLLQKYGREFQPIDVAKCWLANQPKDAYCTAERVAFVNFVNGFYPPVSAIIKNPFREYIGAQIRADYFGYINPGDPVEAADMAWRDASISHVKNGIYGEMFVAAMIADAAVTSDVRKIINAGLRQIPITSRLYDEIQKLLAMIDNGENAETCMAWIHKNYDEGTGYHWCHTISNALIVVSALIFGGLDFGKSICLAVQTGFDTDCNGATVGSIVGMAIGAAGIPKHWTSVFNEKVDTSIFGVGTVSVEEMTELTMKHIKG
ncbi:MAG TPA: ADP-ribosylglycohydrolase family protein [Oscillospiraceae bacterium]|nr:ADP-ribosylglycohydrolase family protein [Oscillospiraceae bacterium]HPS33813.1 ADP-ribosylglycohydrolase family protein [Oscillospiraceae bacterium]